MQWAKWLFVSYSPARFDGAIHSANILWQHVILNESFFITNLHISLSKIFTTGLYKDSPIFSWIASWFVIQFDANFTQILENVTKCQMVFVRLAEWRHMCKLFCTIPQRNHMMNSSVNYPINLWSYSVGNCPVQNKYQTIQCHAISMIDDQIQLL